MAFEWTVAGLSTSATVPAPTVPKDVEAHRKQRTAFKAIFYRAIEDLPWAKVGVLVISFYSSTLFLSPVSCVHENFRELALHLIKKP